MASARLSASARDRSGKGAARSLRREGRIPAVVYGHAREPQSLSVPSRDLERLLEHHAAASTVIELDLEGRTTRTLIREIQRHPVKRQILHVDFQELVAGERVSVKVPLVFVGTPEGVRVGGGMLEQAMHEVSIESDPSDIPARIEVDVTPLQIAEVLHIGDLKLPAGVEALDDAEMTICVVSPPRVVEEVAPVEEAAEGEAEPEVIRKAKTDEDEE